MTGFHGLLPRGIAASSLDDFHFAVRDILPHQIRFGRSGEGILVAGHKQGRHVDGLQVSHRIQALGHASLHLGYASGRHFAHHAQRAIHQVGTGLPRGFSQEIGNHGFEQWLGSTLQNISSGLQTASPGLGRVGRRFRVTQSQSGNPPPMLAPQLDQQIAYDGNSGEGGASDFGVIKDAGEIRGMFLHRSRAFAHPRVAVTAQVGEDQLIAGNQSLCSR